MRIYQGATGTWWKCLLSFFGGVLFTVVAEAGGLFIAGKVVPVKNFIPGDPNQLLTVEYQEKTIVDIVTEAMGGKIKFDTLGDIAKITPVVNNTFKAVNETLNRELGYELDLDEVQTVPLSTIDSYIVTSLKSGITLAGLLKVNDGSEDVLKYLAYPKKDDGTFDKDHPYTLSQFMDDQNFFSDKMDNMTIADVMKPEEGSVAYAIKDKKIKDLKDKDAFNDVKVSELITIDDDDPDTSKILKTFKSKGTTVGSLSDDIDDLHLGEVMEYDSEKFDELSPVLKKLIADSNDSWPGVELLTPLPYTYEFDASKYEFLYITDGDDNISVRKSLDEIRQYTSLSLTTGDKWNIVGSGASGLSDEVMKFTLEINKPAAWEHIFVYEYNEDNGTKVKQMQTAIDGLKLKDVISIAPGSALDKPGIKECAVRDGNTLIDTMKDEMTIGDMFQDDDLDNNKFLKNLPKDTPISNIGSAINDIKLLDAFDEDIYYKDGDAVDPSQYGEMKPSWRYLLTESTEEGLPRPAKRDLDPFNNTEWKEKQADPEYVPANYIYKANDYTIAGSMSKMIDNMQWHMENEPLINLHEDGMIVFNNPAFLDNIVDNTVKDATIIAGVYDADFWTSKEDGDGNVKYGYLTVVEFVNVMSAIV